MDKIFSGVDEILADELFQSWFFKTSPESVAAWERWSAEHPAQQALVQQATRIMSQLHMNEKNISSENVETAASKLLESIGKQKGSVVEIKSPRKTWWIAAAAIAVFALITAATWTLVGKHKEVLATTYGQLSSNTLPDGSEIMLNANSSVRLGQNWAAAGDREVWLSGEAFFRVKRNSTHNRFIVHTDQMDVIVTGTQFNVITRDEQGSVLLTEGSVTIHAKNGDEIKMTPGDFVEIRPDKMEKKTVDQEAVLAWKENKLFFDGTPMKEAARMITAYYGVKVRLADDSVSQKQLYGPMQNNNLDVLLKALEATGNFKITRDENEIVISNP
jgi:transmembrane sensor